MENTVSESEPSPLTPSQSFPKCLRLRKRGQFLRTQRIGQRIYTDHLIVYVAINQNRPTKLGITVSKKLGKAHRRNRIKRLLREAFRHSKLRVCRGFDLLVIAKQEKAPQNLSVLLEELDHLAQQGNTYVRQRALGKSKKRSGKKTKDKSCISMSSERKTQ